MRFREASARALVSSVGLAAAVSHLHDELEEDAGHECRFSGDLLPVKTLRLFVAFSRDFKGDCVM